MSIDIFEIIKSAVKSALQEVLKENENLFEGITCKTETGSNLLTVRQFCEKHPFITEGGMRDKLNSREYNGFKDCVAKGSRRVLIKEKEALDWFSNPPPEANWKYDKKRYGG